MADRRLQVAFLLIMMIFSLLMLLEAFTLLRHHSDFKKGTRYYIRLLTLPASGGTMINLKRLCPEDRQNLNGSGQDQDELKCGGTTL